MEELMIKIDNVTKQYKLGQIGGTTLKDELQRLNARLHHREDPTKKIGAKDYNKGETFMALNGVSFEVRKGERVGIIGHNGAGKSTLLKLLSRVTAPTSGEIGLNGRITSMLEVGTGFHPELTGRENIYMNGAILGMTKKEIDAKIEDIIEFSECRQFIDTPVKRYSSGMYVKLAFSVAAHLDSEIMIMDEVLAVGDMAFQQKCLDKMNDVSRKDGRTILYVSHNMNTIRELCDRVIVLNQGKVIYDGNTEEGIDIYMNHSVSKNNVDFDLDSIPHYGKTSTYEVLLHRFVFINKLSPIFQNTEKMRFCISYEIKRPINNILLRYTIRLRNGTPVGTTLSSACSRPDVGQYETEYSFDLSGLYPGKYCASVGFFEKMPEGKLRMIDHISQIIEFEITMSSDYILPIYNRDAYGPTVFPQLVTESTESPQNN